MTTLNDQAPLWALTAAEASRRLEAGTLTAEALARSCLDRAEDRDPALKAWAFLDRAAVLRQARELDKLPRRGPLHGIPVAIKDVLDTRDMPTQQNSPIYSGFQPAGDAACVAILRAAGAVIFGKTDTTEFAAAGRSALTGNPANLAHTSGGSSAGSAAAVVDGHVPLALGTQTGGSIIRPASFCGAYGFKPSWGSVSREGAKIYSVSLDTVGWFARSAADLELLADMFDIKDDAPPQSRDIAELRIATCRSPAWPQAEAATKARFAEASTLLAEAGATVVSIDLPAEFDELLWAHKVILHREGGVAFLNLHRSHHAQLHDDFHHRVENRDGFSNADLARAYDLAARCRPLFDRLAGDFDAVLTPSAPGEAPPGRIPGDPVFNMMWTLLHVPCVNLPCVNLPGGSSEKGLPVGVTLTAARFKDRQLLKIVAMVGPLLG